MKRTIVWRFRLRWYGGIWIYWKLAFNCVTSTLGTIVFDECNRTWKEAVVKMFKEPLKIISLWLSKTTKRIVSGTAHTSTVIVSGMAHISTVIQANYTSETCKILCIYLLIYFFLVSFSFSFFISSIHPSIHPSIHSPVFVLIHSHNHSLNSLKWYRCHIRARCWRHGHQSTPDYKDKRFVPFLL
jgi:hypothetical protein